MEEEEGSSSSVSGKKGESVEICSKVANDLCDIGAVFTAYINIEDKNSVLFSGMQVLVEHNEYTRKASELGENFICIYHPTEGQIRKGFKVSVKGKYEEIRYLQVVKVKENNLTHKTQKYEFYEDAESKSTISLADMVKVDNIIGWPVKLTKYSTYNAHGNDDDVKCLKPLPKNIFNMPTEKRSGKKGRRISGMSGRNIEEEKYEENDSYLLLENSYDDIENNDLKLTDNKVVKRETVTDFSPNTTLAYVRQNDTSSEGLPLGWVKVEITGVNTFDEYATLLRAALKKLSSVEKNTYGFDELSSYFTDHPNFHNWMIEPDVEGLLIKL